MLFCNSGAEANETAFKIARRTGRPHIVAAQNAFHGRTMGAPGAHRAAAQAGAVRAAAARGLARALRRRAALDAAVDADTAAVVLEPILGEAGVIVPPEGYLRAAREITAARGALLVLDEVQTGIGRTGAWFAHQAGIVPDVVTLAKGLGGGLPIGACIGGGRPDGCSNPASTAPPSAATRSAAPPRSRCSTRSPARGCSSTCGRSARRSPPGSRRWATRSSPTSAEPG